MRCAGIHGGGYQTGAGSVYCNACLVLSSSLRVVVVTFNYRLNIFGFMGSSELSSRTSGGGSGNYGIQDQRAAMAWVKANIGAFGGNGNDITIFGESAGGNSVINHLAQPASFGLYQRAIIESGVYNAGAESMSDAEKGYKLALASAGCSDLNCLLATDEKIIRTKVLGAAAGLTDGRWGGPVVDGVSLTDTPLGLIYKKRYNNRVPVIVGSNSDEQAFFTLLNPTAFPVGLTEAQFDAALGAGKPGGMPTATLAKLKQVYDPSVYPYPEGPRLGSYSKWYWMYVRWDTDRFPGLGPCSVRWLDEQLLAGGTPAVYSYLFAHPAEAWAPQEPGGTVFAPHASELSFVFGQPEPLLSKKEAALAAKVAAYWYSFAISPVGDPNPTSGQHVAWPKWTPATDTVLRMEAADAGGMRTEVGLRKAACDWEGAGDPAFNRSSNFLKTDDDTEGCDMFVAATERAAAAASGIQTEFGSIAEAQAALRERLSAADNLLDDREFVVCLGPGTHRVAGEPLLFDEADSPRGRGRVVWRGSTDAPSVVTGGVQVTGWGPAAKYGPGAYQAKVPAGAASLAAVRQLWVQGVRANRTMMETAVDCGANCSTPNASIQCAPGSPAPHSCPDDAPTCVGYEYNVSWGHCEVCQCHSNNSLPVFTPWVVKVGATPTAAGFTTSKPLPESWIGKKATRAIEMAWPIVSDDDLFVALTSSPIVKCVADDCRSSTTGSSRGARLRRSSARTSPSPRRARCTSTRATPSPSSRPPCASRRRRQRKIWRPASSGTTQMRDSSTTCRRRARRRRSWRMGRGSRRRKRC